MAGRNYSTVASGAEERGGGGGARAQPGHVLIFRHSSRFVLICMHFCLYNYMIDPTCTCTVQCLLEKMCACIWLPVNHS